MGLFLYCVVCLMTLTVNVFASDTGLSRYETEVEAGTDSVDQEGDGAGVSKVMTGLLYDALKKLALKKNEEALVKLDKKDYPGALNLIQAAYDLDNENPEIANNLGYIYYLLGNDQEAERFLRLALKQDSNRYVTHINLADILGREGENPTRLLEAQVLLKKARELKGNRADVILKQASVARLLGAYEEAERFYQSYLEKQKPTDRLKIEIGDFFRDLGRTDEALAWYQRVQDEKNLGKEAAGRIWDIEVERQAKQFGWSLPPQTIPTKARTLASKGQIQLNRANFGEAERLLKQAVSLAPGFAKARMHLGDVYKGTGRFKEAELAFLRALAVENNAETCYRLGDLYLEDATPARNAEAALFMARALDYRPDWSELRFSLARALRAIGDMAGASQQLDLFLASPNQGEKREAALALKQSIGSFEPLEADSVNLKTGGDDDSGDAMLSTVLGRTRAHLAKGRPEAAMAELRGLAKKHRGTPVLNLEAQILFSSGRKKEALKVLQRSLRINANQGNTQEQMGIVCLSLGNREQALAHFTKAKELGVASADYHLACLQVPRGEAATQVWLHSVLHLSTLLRVRSDLESFLGRGSPSVYRADAEAFSRDLEARISLAVITLAALFALLLFLPVYWRWRKVSGQGLAGLIDTHPEAGADVQRILSAIRHEILKHNTMVLGGLIDAIDNNDEDVSKKAKHFHGSLKGTSGREPVRKRLEFYADELSKVGRLYKFRLNLRHRDPAIGALLRGFSLLDKASPFLNSFETLGRGQKQRLRAMLDSAARLLNDRGYGEVQDLLDSIRVLSVNSNVIKKIATRVQSEPGFTDKRAVSIDITSETDEPLDVSVPRQVFEDIMANLIRNALQSSDGCAVSMDGEVDPITGLERAVFSVKDKSDKKLDLDMIKNRNIEAGLGLTAALVSRHDGTLDVVPEQGEWKKSVRVKLPVASR